MRKTSSARDATSDLRIEPAIEAIKSENDRILGTFCQSVFFFTFFLTLVFISNFQIK